MWGTALAVQGWALHLGELGLRSVATSEAARRPAALPALLRTYLSLRLLISALVVAAVGAAALAPAAVDVTLLVTLSILATALQLDWVPLTQGREARAAALLLARPTAFLLLALIVLPHEPGTLAALWLAAWCVAAAVSWHRLQLEGDDPALPSGLLLRRGLPLATVTLLNQTQLGLDIVIVGLVLGAAPAGDYWLASQMAVAGLVVANAANQMALARLAAVARAGFIGALMAQLRLVTAAGIALAFLAAAAAPAVPLLFGSEHGGAGDILWWLLPWLVLQHPSAVLQGALAALGRGREVLLASVAGAVALAAGVAVAVALADPRAFALSRALAEAARLGLLGLALTRRRPILT